MIIESRRNKMIAISDEDFKIVKDFIINEIKDEYANCDVPSRCNNCMFSRYGKIRCIFEEGETDERM